MKSKIQALVLRPVEWFAELVLSSNAGYGLAVQDYPFAYNIMLAACCTCLPALVVYTFIHLLRLNS